MDKWVNGDKGKTVKEIIDRNFEILETSVLQLKDRPVIHFYASDWVNGVIFINYSQYNKLNPCVDLYIKNGDGYSFVYGGYEIKDNGIELQSDIAYEGKVVIR